MKNQKTVVIAALVGLVAGYVASAQLDKVPVVNKLPKL